MMLPPVFQVLQASTAVTSIVSNRVYRHGAAPQGVSKPYVTWSIAGAAPANNLTDLPPIDQYIVQVDCWSPSDAGIETLAESVRNAIEPYAHMTGIVINQRELADTKLFRMGLQFDWWHDRYEAQALSYVLGLSGDQSPGHLDLSGDQQTGSDGLII